MKRADITGKIFGRLKALSFKYVKNKNSYWKCICECGKVVIVSYANLMRGKTKSCGCLNKELTIKRNLIHGKTNTRLYRIWENMRTRCYNSKTINFHLYGGRGIKVCEEWKNDFISFYNWAMYNGYKKGLSIDRIDNDGNYEPKNCRWATEKQQSRNTRTNRLIKIRGEIHCFSEWVEKLKLTQSALRYRINKNWSEERILNTPLRRINGKR